MTRVLNSLLLITLLTVAAIEIFLVTDGTVNLSDALVPLFLLAAGLSSLFFRTQRPVSLIVAGFLGSVSVLVSGLSPEDMGILIPSFFALPAKLLWTTLLWMAPFVFLHFSLVFPIKSSVIDKFPRLSSLLYAPPLFLLTASQIEASAGIVDQFFWLFPLSLLSGLAIFIHQYVYPLTDAEKLRLRVVLIGCLAGVVPRLFYLIGREDLPPIANQLSLLLLPLFPICLLVSVHTENLSEFDPKLHDLIVAAVTTAAWIAVSFLLFVTVFLAFPTLTRTAASALVFAGSLLLLIPVSRYAPSYLTGRSLPKFFRSRAETVVFQPIEHNPFIVGNPVRQEEMFFGRRAEFHFLQNTLKSQKSGCIIVLTGERRTGKTSILLQIRNGRLGGDYVPVFLDMQGVIARNDAEFLEILAREFERAAERESLLYSRFSEASTPYTALREFLVELIRLRRGARFLVLVDEYELIEERVAAGNLSPEIPRYLNSLIEGIPGLSFVLTGSRPFETRPLWSALLGKSFYREISFLERSDAEELITKPLQNRVSVGDEIVAQFIRLAAGHPYYTQVLGQNLVDSLNEFNGSLTDSQLLEKTVSRVLDHPPPQLLYLWAGLSESEKLVLTSLAGLLRRPTAYVPWSRVHSVLGSVSHEKTRGFGQLQTRIELEAMRQRRILDRDQNRYRFTMDLLRRWISTEHTLWSVLAESSPKA